MRPDTNSQRTGMQLQPGEVRGESAGGPEGVGKLTESGFAFLVFFLSLWPYFFFF